MYSVQFKLLSKQARSSTKVQLIKSRRQDADLESNSTNLKSRKKPWTEAEDQLVIRLVEQNGPHKWTYIANHLDGRIGKQCRERWHNHLNPQIKKTPWEDQEEWMLFLYHKAIENKWAEIAKHIVGRTDNSIKNHWNSGMKRRIPEFQERLAKLSVQASIEGHGVLNKVKSDLEKKALEIILFNRKYECIASESEDEPENYPPVRPLISASKKIQKVKQDEYEPPHQTFLWEDTPNKYQTFENYQTPAGIAKRLGRKRLSSGRAFQSSLKEDYEGLVPINLSYHS